MEDTTAWIKATYNLQEEVWIQFFLHNKAYAYLKYVRSMHVALEPI